MIRIGYPIIPAVILVSPCARVCTHYYCILWLGRVDCGQAKI
jgi:hypothetical protein